MTNNYELNTYFLRHLSDYNIQLKEIAKCLAISVSAVSQAITNNSFTMLDIDTIAEFGSFTHGSFMKMKNGTSNHSAQVPKYTSPIYRLFYLHADLISIYGSQEKISQATGVTVEKIRLLKEKVPDGKGGWMTPPSVLSSLLYREFLNLISHIDNVDPWRYINDDNGCFPISEEMTNKLIPAQSYILSLAQKEEQLQEAAMAREDIETKLNALTLQNRENKKEIQSLRKSLKEEQKSNSQKHSRLNNMRADSICARNNSLRLIEKIYAQIEMLEKNHPNESAPYTLAIRRDLDKLSEINK